MLPPPMVVRRICLKWLVQEWQPRKIYLPINWILKYQTTIIMIFSMKQEFDLQINFNHKNQSDRACLSHFLPLQKDKTSSDKCIFIFLKDLKILSSIVQCWLNERLSCIYHKVYKVSISFIQIYMIKVLDEICIISKKLTNIVFYVFTWKSQDKNVKTYFLYMSSWRFA